MEVAEDSSLLSAANECILSDATSADCCDDCNSSTSGLEMLSA